MASSSVSQDDIDNDFEKNNRRSRIRTARARQINPSGTVNQNKNIIFKNMKNLRTFQNLFKIFWDCSNLCEIIYICVGLFKFVCTYHIFSYSCLGNYYFLNLEIEANSNSCWNFSIFYLTTEGLLRKLFKGGNFSRVENMPCDCRCCKLAQQSCQTSWLRREPFPMVMPVVCRFNIDLT